MWKQHCQQCVCNMLADETQLATIFSIKLYIFYHGIAATLQTLQR